MARYRMDQLDKWAAKVERRLEHVAETATRRVFDLAQANVPVDDGDLLASLTFKTGAGAKSHLSASSALSPGLVRGLWLSPYAVLAHYGDAGRQGTFWRDKAVMAWPRIVREAAAEAKAVHK